jgi:hypothetical protein
LLDSRNEVAKDSRKTEFLLLKDGCQKFSERVKERKSIKFLVIKK